MTHAELLNLALSIHGAVFVGSLAAFYKYGDRTDVFAKSLAGTDSALSRIRKMISDELLTTVRECLHKKTPNLQPILGPDGTTYGYSEKTADLLESEAFRPVRHFIDLRTDSISDYHILIRARENWCFWARMLSWSILLSIILQLVFLVIHGLVDHVLGYPLPDWSIFATLIISAVVVLVVLGLFVFLLKNHDVILQQKVKYDAP